jgi:hypothetical protein
MLMRSDSEFSVSAELTLRSGELLSVLPTARDLKADRNQVSTGLVVSCGNRAASEAVSPGGEQKQDDGEDNLRVNRHAGDF